MDKVSDITMTHNITTNSPIWGLLQSFRLLFHRDSQALGVVVFYRDIHWHRNL